MAEQSAPTSPNRPRSKHKLLKRIITLIVLAALAAGAWYGYAWYTKKSPEAAFTTVEVTTGDIEKTVTSVGSLKPKEYVDVGTQVSGRVIKIHVGVGQRIKKGDLIAEIDPTVYQSTVQKSQANLDNLKAQLGQQIAELELAEMQYERNKKMLESDAVSRDTVDQLASALKVSRAKRVATEAQIKAAEATLSGDQANLGYTKIYAPISGTVVSQTTLEGQTINSSQSAPVIVQVAQLDVMTVWAQVAEADITRISQGLPVYFTTLGMPDRRWQGKVRLIEPTPTVKNDVVLYNVLIDVDNKEGLLLPTMTVQVFFVLGEARQVPIVPLSALRAAPDKGADAYRARVLTPEGPRPRQVTVGVTNRTNAQIVSGLQVGDKVITGESGSSPRGPNAGNTKSGQSQQGQQRQQGFGPGGPGGFGPRL